MEVGQVGGHGKSMRRRFGELVEKLQEHGYVKVVNDMVMVKEIDEVWAVQIRRKRNRGKDKKKLCGGQFVALDYMLRDPATGTWVFVDRKTKTPGGREQRRYCRDCRRTKTNWICLECKPVEENTTKSAYEQELVHVCQLCVDRHVCKRSSGSASATASSIAAGAASSVAASSDAAGAASSAGSASSSSGAAMAASSVAAGAASSVAGAGDGDSFARWVEGVWSGGGSASASSAATSGQQAGRGAASSKGKAKRRAKAVAGLELLNAHEAGGGRRQSARLMEGGKGNAVDGVRWHQTRGVRRIRGGR